MEFLAFLGGFWGVVWTLALIALLVTSVEFESAAAAWLVLAVFVIVGDWTGLTAIVPWILDNPLRLIGVVAVYVAIGALWSMYKFRRDLVRNDYRLAGKSGKRASVAASEIVDDAKSRIVLWISMWPVSMLWWAVRDLMLEFWTRIFDMFRSVYEKIAYSALEEKARRDQAEKTAVREEGLK